MDEFDITEDDKNVFFANIVRFLAEGGELSAARAFLSCSMNLEFIMGYSDDHPPYACGYAVELSAPRNIYDILSDRDNEDGHRIRWAIKAILRTKTLDDIDINVNANVDRRPLQPGWREQLHDLITDGGKVTNQGNTAEKSDYYRVWEGLRFRSETERRIAATLDKRGVLYMPNCLARIGKPTERRNLEVDFLVCSEGKWGILEVDGEPYHTGLAARDHDRDRLFRSYRILAVERFNATECFENAEGVVTKFLQLIKNT